MKNVLALFVIIGAVAIQAAGTDLLRFVPGNIRGMACIDMTKGWQHPAFQRIRRNDPTIDSQCRLLESKLAQYRLRPEQAITGMAVFYRDSNSVGSVFHTNISEAQFDKMLASGITKGTEHMVQVQKKNANGYRYYLVKSQYNGKRLPDSGFTYIGTNQVLMAPVEQLDEVRSSLSKGSVAGNKFFANQIRMINTNAPFWTVFSVPEEISRSLAANSQGNAAAAYMSRITNGAFAVDTSGKTNRDFMISGFLTCTDPGTAKQMAQQLQLMPMACNDTRTAMRVNESMSLSTKGNTLFLRMLIPESMHGMFMGFAQPGSSSAQTQQSASQQYRQPTQTQTTARYQRR